MIKLKDILSEVANADINQIASTLAFKPVTKQKLVYKYIDGGKPGSMPPMTYTKSTIQQPVVTTTSDGKETQNTADVGDIIFSGATGENYVIKAAKLPKLYTGNVGGDIYPEQSPLFHLNFLLNNQPSIKSPTIYKYSHSTSLNNFNNFS